MPIRSSSSIVMKSVLVTTWVSYLLLCLCFQSGSNMSVVAATSSVRNRTLEFPSRPDGVIFVSHAASGPAREAVYTLSRFGFQVLVGVKTKLERQSYLYSLRKGIELIDFDVSDPSTYPPLIYRLRHIRRDLDRPIVGVIINLADELKLERMKSKNAIDVAYVEERFRAISKNPFRIVQALLELNRHQINDNLRSNRQVKRDSWLSDKSTVETPTESNKISKYPWDSEAFRITILTRDYKTRAPFDSICDLDCLQQDLFVRYVSTLLETEMQLVKNATLSIIHSSWDLNQLKTAEKKGTKSTGDVIGFTQGIHWTIDLEDELIVQQGAIEEEAFYFDQSNDNKNQLCGKKNDNNDKNNAKKDNFKEEEQVKRAIVHSFVSRRPWSEYSIEHYQHKEIPLPRFPK